MQFTRKDPYIDAWPVHDVIANFLNGPNRGDRAANLHDWNVTVSEGFDRAKFSITSSEVTAGMWVITTSDGTHTSQHSAGWLVYEHGKWKVYDSVAFWHAFELDQR